MSCGPMPSATTAATTCCTSTRGGQPPGTPRGLHATWRGYLEQNLDAHVRTCVDLGAISASEGERILAGLADGLPRDEEVEPRLLHGDLGSHNVLSDGTAIRCL